VFFSLLLVLCCRASLLFLHVQDSNAPARSLYQKAGFSSAAVLPGYYSKQLSQRRRFEPQEQQQQQDGAAQLLPGSGTTAGLSVSAGVQQEFSSTDAELLVMRVNAAAALQAGGEAPLSYANSDASSAASSFTGRGSSSSSSAEEAMLAAAPPSRMQAGRSQQQKPLLHYSRDAAPSSSSSSSSKLPDAAEAAEMVTEVASSAAAAAVRLLLGPAVGLLGGVLGARRGSSGSSSRGFFGSRGELVQLGDEWMVQVRQGGNVVMYDPDEVPEDVVLSDRDKVLLQRQRQRQQELKLVAQQRQQQQEQRQRQRADSDDDDDSDGSSGFGNSQSQGLSSTGSSAEGFAGAIEQQQQQQQQPAGVGPSQWFSAWQGCAWQQEMQQRQHQLQQQFRLPQRALFQRASQVAVASGSRLLVQSMQQQSSSSLSSGSSRMSRSNRPVSCLRTLPTLGYVAGGSRLAAGTCLRSCLAS
jgi:hypothetical protein